MNVPIKGKRNVLITSALPYVNNVPHLGNLIGCVLSGDVFSRYCRQRGYNTLYICGTDEYGTATETKARQEGLTPKEICTKYWKKHKEIYEWFGIDFSHFGRTSTEKQTEISQSIFKDLYDNGLFEEKVIEQLYCEHCKMFLADRYIKGICPHCKYDDSRGDQCDKCGKLLNSNEIINPKCSICDHTPQIKSSKHLFLKLPEVSESLDKWVNESIAKGHWSSVAKSITKSWLKEGLQERCITRDLKWGTPVPLKGFEDKVFYVWFDAPIGYMSITANLTDEWKQWWLPDPNDKETNIEYFQFLAKDNVPFHGIIFPSTLLGTKRNWKLVDSICSTHYLNYEEKKFSKSKGTGVFGDQAKTTEIPVEVWRYYLLTNRPEQQDTQFFWNDLKDKNNNELLKNLGNFVNRALKFCESSLNKTVPEVNLSSLQEEEREKNCIKEVETLLKKYIKKMEHVKIKEALHTALLISKIGNQYLQDSKPWELIKTDEKKCGMVIYLSIQLVYCVCSILQPFIPNFVKKTLQQMNLIKENEKKEEETMKYLPISEEFNLEAIKSGHVLGKIYPIFRKLGDVEIKKYKKMFGGQEKIEFPLLLKVGKIEKAEDHPKNPRNFIVEIDVGEDKPRTVIAGIKKVYEKKEDVLGKKVIVVCNIGEKDFGDFVSNGMLLAESKKRNFKVLEPPSDDLPVGTQILPENCEIEIEDTLSPKSLKAGLRKLKVDEEGFVHIEENRFIAKLDKEVLYLKSQIGKGARIS